MTTNLWKAFVCLATLAGSAIDAASLKPETQATWREYVSAANGAMHARAKSSQHFLLIDERPDLAAQVRANGFYVTPANPQVPKKVTSGLIHDWIGISFIPNAKVDDLLRVIRDYKHYKDVYSPGVLNSVPHGVNGERDFFSLRLVNRSVVAQTALDVDTESTYFRVDDKRWYSISKALHIREVRHPGTSDEEALPEDEGTGLIWRLSSITRLEERDGGVYLEVEALALSRDIPGALRLFVMPIVKRVSKDSLLTSLRQTSAAVNVTVARNGLSGQLEHAGQ